MFAVDVSLGIGPFPNCMKRRCSWQNATIPFGAERDLEAFATVLATFGFTSNALRVCEAVGRGPRILRGTGAGGGCMLAGYIGFLDSELRRPPLPRPPMERRLLDASVASPELST